MLGAALEAVDQASIACGWSPAGWKGATSWNMAEPGAGGRGSGIKGLGVNDKSPATASRGRGPSFYRADGSLTIRAGCDMMLSKELVAFNK